MSDFTPADMVRIELLRYPNPDGLHPVEEQWRDLGRKILNRLEETEAFLVQALNKCPEYYKRDNAFTPTKFPKKFNPDNT